MLGENWLDANEPLVIAALLAVAVFAFAALVLRLLERRGSVRRRAMPARAGSDAGGQGARDGQATRLFERVASLVTPSNRKAVAEAGRKLVQAGYLSPSAVKVYYALRIAMAAGLAAVSFFIPALLTDDVPIVLSLWLTASAAGVGLILPSILLDARVSQMREKYRRVFPDFMDLLVVCVQAGQSLPSAIARVSREMVEICPELAANLHLVTLELRAGGTVTSALANLHGRLGISEVQSLTVLLKQAEELGTSISSTLRIYSDEMRDKRLLRAEAKASALPVKMTIPLGLFIFPVILIVILTPVVIRIKNAFM